MDHMDIKQGFLSWGGLPHLGTTLESSRNLATRLGQKSSKIPEVECLTVVGAQARNLRNELLWISCTELVE